MKVVLALLLVSLFSSNDPRDIAKTNSLKKSAEKAFLEKDYAAAISNYSMLLDTMKVADDKALLNLGHAYFKSGDTTNATRSYQQLSSAQDPKLQSVAYQQLGVLNQKPQELAKSAQYFKQALKADPTNEEARYNYELVKKKLEEQKKNEKNQDDNQDQDKKDQDKKEEDKKEQEQKDQEKKDQENKQDQKDQQKQDQENKEKQDQEKQDKKDGEKSDDKDQKNEEKGENGEKGEKSDADQQKEQSPEQMSDEEKKEGQQPPMPSTQEKLQEINLTEEKAKMILDAMRQGEKQYIQQLKKKPVKAPDSKKPDW